MHAPHTGPEQVARAEGELFSVCGRIDLSLEDVVSLLEGVVVGLRHPSRLVLDPEKPPGIDDEWVSVENDLVLAPI